MEKDVTPTKHIWPWILIICIFFSCIVGYSYIETIKEQNEIERERIESTERLRQNELEQERALEQAKLDRELEADCQQQIASLRLRYNNIESGGYNKYLEYCEVNFKDAETGMIESGNIKDMVTAEKKIENKFITLDSHSTTYYFSPIKITGKVSSNTKKITVSASGPGYTDRDYVLTNFRAGDTTFQYQMSDGFNNLKPGINIYSFVAYFNDGSTERAILVINYQPFDE